jgi:NitT/TauT family transport system substrate-binding protein
VHDKGSGNKLFADKVWYVQGQKGLAAFLLKDAADAYAAKNKGVVLAYAEARKAKSVALTAE